MKKNYRIYLKYFYFILLLSGIRCEDIFRSKYEIMVDEYKILVELAVTPQQRQKGLMYRKQLPENEGMLFVFPEENYQTFWMKNTYIPLDVGFFDKDGFLIEVQSMLPDQSKILYRSSEPAKYALEVNHGWFKKRKIKKYARLKLSSRAKKMIVKLQKQTVR